jgi:hypothetical protein
MGITNVSSLWNGWKAPDGLNRALPRQVDLTGRGIAMYVLSAVILAGGIAGAILLDQDMRAERAEASRMTAEGQTAEGTVERLSRSGSKSEEYRVNYQFEVDGQTHTGRANIRESYWKGLQPGAAIEVRYLPSDPSHNYPSQNPPNGIDPWMPLTVGVLCLAICGLPILKVRRERRLLESGRPAPGVVTRCRRAYGNRGGPKNWLYYEYAPPGEGTTKARAAVSRQLPEGSLICVLYDPENPRRSAPYPMCLVKLSSE